MASFNFQYIVLSMACFMAVIIVTSAFSTRPYVAVVSLRMLLRSFQPCLINFLYEPGALGAGVGA